LFYHIAVSTRHATPAFTSSFAWSFLIKYGKILPERKDGRFLIPPTTEPVQRHYEQYPYPRYPLLASVRTCDTYALNLQSLWSYGNGEPLPPEARTVLIAGCGTFAPYPFSVANPDCTVTALDLSAQSLKRARLHSLLHGRRNIRFQVGNLEERTLATGPFGLIDAFGVLHHLEDPRAGLQALVERLASGGIIRLMLYSRITRRDEEALRYAFRLLGVTSVDAVRDMVRRAPLDSRLRAFFQSSREMDDDTGVADALLHPRVRTYRIDEVLLLLREAGLKVLRYAHNGALADSSDEEERLRTLERNHCSPGNFVLYAVQDNSKRPDQGSDAMVELNPCLRGVVTNLLPGSVKIPARFGGVNPLLGWSDRRFLHRFRRPVPLSVLSVGEQERVHRFMAALFLSCSGRNGVTGKTPSA
jgi:SAM-dependent methyltransferase